MSSKGLVFMPRMLKQGQQAFEVGGVFTIHLPRT